VDPKCFDSSTDWCKLMYELVQVDTT
jgi:hypothetical protein